MRIDYSKPGGDVGNDALNLRASNRCLLDEQQRTLPSLDGCPPRTRCLLCDAGLEATRQFMHRGVPVGCCAACGHVQLAVIPPAGYPDAVSGRQSFTRIYPELDRPTFEDRTARIYAPKLDWVLGCADAMGCDAEALRRRSWVELGCGRGHFLQALLDAGIERVTGIDTCAPLVESTNAMLGRPVARLGSADPAASALAHPADVYVAWFVLEHIEEPQAFWAAMASRPPGTVFCFSVPTFGLSTMLETAVGHHYARNLDAVVHCQLYTERSIAYALERAGYRQVAQWVFGQDGWDLWRMLLTGLEPHYPPELLAEVAGSLAGLIDPVQQAVDKAHLSETRHVIAVKA